MTTQRIYLDNAATSWPKPDGVVEEMTRYLRELGAPAGRGTYAEAAEVERRIYQARQSCAELTGVERQQVAFTLNGTDSLNMAIQGLLRPGDHVITSVVEHNSVLRPLRELERLRQISVTRVKCDDTGRFSPISIRDSLRPRTRLVALTHGSNVTGAIQPIAEVGQILAGHPAFFLVDAAQTAGHFSINLTDLGADLVACSGHKGLLGPLGVGLLAVSPKVNSELRSCRQGGTGSDSDTDQQPEQMPDKLEAGNLNVPGIFGLAAALDWIAAQDRAVPTIRPQTSPNRDLGIRPPPRPWLNGVERLRQGIQERTAELLDGLRGLSKVTIYGPTSAAESSGVISINVHGFAPQEVANMLDTAYSIQVRPGIHCAPLIHEALGTLGSGGTIRFSIGPFNTSEQIAVAIEAMTEITLAGTP